MRWPRAANRRSCKTLHTSYQFLATFPIVEPVKGASEETLRYISYNVALIGKQRSEPAAGRYLPVQSSVGLKSPVRFYAGESP
jgi:hypothetical protein